MHLRRVAAALVLVLVSLLAQAATARGLNPPPADNSAHLYTLDGWGGVHPVGASPTMSNSAYWSGWDIARGMALFNDGSGGYSLDGWGAIHALGSAPATTHQSAYWGGWDIARAITLAPWATPANPAGWTLDGWGGIHPFGSAPAVSNTGYWQGWDIARGLVVFQDSTPGTISGYTLDGFGGLHPFAGGGAPMPPNAQTSASWNGWDIARSAALVSGTHGGYVLDGWGALHQFTAAGGTMPPPEVGAYWSGWDIARSVTTWTAAAPGTPGGWTLDGWGGVHPFGSAPSPGAFAYWQGWDIAHASAGAGSGSGSRAVPVTSRTLNVPYFHQVYELSCEEAALEMALGYEGIALTQGDILNAIGIDWRRPVTTNGQFHWGDPYANFVGDPNGSEVNNTGYGTYLSTIAGAASHFGGRVVAAGEGFAPTNVYSSIIAGHPVVVWISFDYAAHNNSSYQAFDGRWVMFGSPYEHAATVAGVTDSSVLINDPWRGQMWISKGSFETAYAVFNDMAVVIN